MRKIYRHTERGFEILTSTGIAILSNSITFIVALCMVIYWFTNEQFYTQDIHSSIGDVILGLTFLSLFIIQKSFNHFSASLHIKINELVSSHEPANNAVMTAEGKTEDELIKLSKEYTDLAEMIKEDEEVMTSTAAPPPGHQRSDSAV